MESEETMYARHRRPAIDSTRRQPSAERLSRAIEDRGEATVHFGDGREQSLLAGEVPSDPIW